MRLLPRELHDEMETTRYPECIVRFTFGNRSPEQFCVLVRDLRPPILNSRRDASTKYGVEQGERIVLPHTLTSEQFCCSMLPTHDLADLWRSFFV